MATTKPGPTVGPTVSASLPGTADASPQAAASHIHFGSADCYTILRGQLEHEDTLINHRLSWLITSQAILFGFYVNATRDPSATPMLQVREVLSWGALLTCVLMYITIMPGLWALTRLRKEYEACRAQRSSEQAIVPELFPRTPGWTHHWGLAAPIALPILFIGGWLYIIISTRISTPH
jgi:hypothetical protein